LPSGEVVVGVRDGPSFAPWLFDSRTGGYLGRLGRVGRGPGEYIFPTVFQVVGDRSLFVLDRNQYRYSLLSASGRGSFRWLSGGPLPGKAYDAVVFGSGSRFVVNAALGEAKAAGLPLHLFDSTGTLLRSFGADTARLDPRDDEQIIRVLATSGDTAVWSAPHRYVYRFDLFSTDGRRLRSLVPKASWYPRWRREDFRPTTPDSPPLPFLMSLREGPGQLLWCAVAVADRNWHRGLGPARGGELARAWYPVDDWSRVYDTMVEVFDSRTGRLVASQRIDQFVAALPTDGRVATIALHDEQPRVVLYRALVK
jgi:hypothetical protein